ncbi:hypothetical protein GGF31_007676 [Allomyces arbusculus]|nr:hypothetical protein GGF31_007676 [Allomyces arbusculus]
MTRHFAPARAAGAGTPRLVRTALAALVATAVLLLAFTTPHVAAATNEPVHGTTLFIRSQSLYPPYIDYDMSNRWWEFGGAAVVHTNKYIRLTPDLHARKGWIMAKSAFDASAWSVEFEYKIHGRGTSLFGDGFAFWFTKDQHDAMGPVLGHEDKWDGLAVVFDTYDNGRHGYTYPYVAALLNDGTKAYNKDTDGKHLEIGGCQADIRGKQYATRARVRYVAGQYLKVDLNTKGWDDWTTCFNVANVTLPKPGHFAFTAETGGLSDNHDIVSVSVNQIVSDDQTHNNPAQPSTWSSSFMTSPAQGPSAWTVVLIVLGVAGAAVAGVKYMQAQSKPARAFKQF